jgi:hypothetical protein
MPQTQAYSVDWTVTVEPEGDVSQDVVEIVFKREADAPNSVTVELDTSKRPHALQERRTITVELTDGNDTVQFSGFIDDVSDDDSGPTVTVDARSNEGQLDDGTVVGHYSEDNLWRVVDEIFDIGPSRLRDISFDVEGHIARHGVWASTTEFGKLDVAYYPRFAFKEEAYTQNEIISGDRGKPAELRIDTYENTTETTYTLTISGVDASGNNVNASLDLPPGETAADAYGTENVKLALLGGNELWAEVTGISTDIPDLEAGPTSDDIGVAIGGTLTNYVKTDWQFPAKQDNNHRDFLDNFVSYVESLDGGDWEAVVDDNDELWIQPVKDDEPTLHSFVEGQNVIRPMARRNLDNVANYVKVSGRGNVNVWVWAYSGSVYVMWGYNTPHQRGVFPDDTSDQFTWKWKDSDSVNDIDQIGLRADTFAKDRISSWQNALRVAQDVFDDVYQSTVNGTAPVTGIMDVQPGDKAEVYYPSRGIPGRAVDNIFRVQKIEYRITPREAKTSVEFGSNRPTATKAIADAAVDRIQKRRKTGRPTGGFDPVVGEIAALNGDGTATIDAEDGNIYENVRII